MQYINQHGPFLALITGLRIIHFTPKSLLKKKKCDVFLFYFLLRFNKIKGALTNGFQNRPTHAD